jgi:hypothetical protein
MKEYLICHQYLALIGHSPIKIELWATIIPLTEDQLALDFYIMAEGKRMVPPLGLPMKANQAVAWFLDYVRFYLCHLIKCFAYEEAVEV